jgi:hypothetical protein
MPVLTHSIDTYALFKPPENLQKAMLYEGYTLNSRLIL